MTWSDLDWEALDRLRDGFLHGGAAHGPYWKNRSALASYDLTYGERIGWKWDQVLRELNLRNWTPHSRTLLDWGCGSGIASRRVIASFGPDQFDSLLLWDHEAVAMEYAEDRARKEFPNLDVQNVTPRFLEGDSRIGLLVVSHVLNELSSESLSSLQALISRAESIIWVEPGTPEVSRQLGAIRDSLSEHFHIVAPCTHQQSCPILTEGHERDWCHFFAPPPSSIFADSDWVKFGQRAGIDLRSLPYSFLALDRQPTAKSASGLSRILGRPKQFKPYTRFLNCDQHGLDFVTLPKRQDPALYKELDRSKSPLVYHWTRENGTIQTGSALQPEQ